MYMYTAMIMCTRATIHKSTCSIMYLFIYITVAIILIVCCTINVFLVFCYSIYILLLLFTEPITVNM